MSRLSLDILIVHCLFLSSLSLNSLPAIKQPTNQPKKKKKKIPRKYTRSGIYGIRRYSLEALPQIIT